MNSCSRNDCCFGALAEIVTLCFSSSPISAVLDGLRAIGDERVVVVPSSADHLALEHDLLDRAVLYVRQERRVRNRLGALTTARTKALEDGQQDDGDYDPKNDVLCQVVQCVTSRAAR